MYLCILINASSFGYLDGVEVVFEAAADSISCMEVFDMDLEGAGGDVINVAYGEAGAGITGDSPENDGIGFDI